MKYGKAFIKLIIALILAAACIQVNVYAADTDDDVFYISAGGKQMKVQMVDNAATQKLKEMLGEGDLTINMTRNGFEQYGSLGTSLPSSDTSITAKAGDVLLYNSDTICVFYGSNSYSYTRIGKVQNMSNTELKELLSGESLTFTLSKKSFGTVPNTGVESRTLKFAIMVFAGCVAVMMWVIVCGQKNLRGESIEKTQKISEE